MSINAPIAYGTELRWLNSEKDMNKKVFKTDFTSATKGIG